MQRTLGPAISAALAALLISSPPVLAAPPAGVGGGPPGGFPGGGMSGGDFPGRGAGSVNAPWGSGFGGNHGDQRVVMAHSSSSVLADNPHAVTALGNALQKSGVDVPAGGLQSACASFGNLGNCMSALHVARNLSLPGGFDALKQLMTTGSKLPLGKAIIQLDPKADAKLAESTARKQARADLRHADAETSGD